MVDQDYVNALINFGKLERDNVGILEDDFAGLYAKIRAQEGKQVVSVSVPGQTVSWAQSMTVQEQFSALSQALNILHGSITILRRTTARFF
jgi:hypothetical protein